MKNIHPVIKNMKHNKLIIKILFSAICLQHSYLLAQDLTADSNKIKQTNVNYISAYFGGFNYTNQLKDPQKSCLCDNSDYSSYDYESGAFSIGVGHDFSKSKSLELRYSDFGTLAIVNKVGNYADYFHDDEPAHKITNQDNKTTINRAAIELYYKWYYYSFNLFKGSAYNGDLSFGLGVALTYYFYDITVKDGDYHKSEQTQGPSFMLMPLAITYRINNYLFSASYYSVIAFEYGFIGVQYYFS